MKYLPSPVRRIVAGFSVGAIAAVGLATTATAADFTWDGGGSDTNINTAGNWDADVVPDLVGGTDTLIFGTGGATATVNTDASVLGLTFNRDTGASGTAFTLAGGAATAITLGTGGITAGGIAYSTAGARTYVVSENVALNGNQTWAINNGTSGASTSAVGVTLSVSGALSGSSTLTKGGTGSLQLSGNNTGYTGAVNLQAGTLRAENSSALGSATLTTTGTSSTFQMNFSTNSTLANNVVLGSGANNGNVSINSFQGTNRVYTLSGNFSTGTNVGVNTTLSYTPSGNTTTESRFVLTGDHTALNGSGTSGNVTTINLGGFSSDLGGGLRGNAAAGTLQFDTQSSIASNVNYTFNGGSTSSVGGVAISNKYIINGAFTFANQVTVQNQGTNLNVNSVGATHATGTATWSGGGTSSTSLAVGANRVNVFSQNTGALFDVSGAIVSNANAGQIFINESYSYTNESGGVELRTPTGTVAFSRADGITYSGSVSVVRGTLLVNNVTSSTARGSGSGSLSVASGATLGGTGSIRPSGTNSVTISGTLAPGNSTAANPRGTLVFNGDDTTASLVTLNSGADIKMELGAINDSDQIEFWNYTNGDLIVNNNNIEITLNPGAAVGTYTLIEFFSDNGTTLTPTDVGSGLTVSFTNAGANGTLVYGTDSIQLNLTAVPEPGTLALIGVAGLALGVFRRRRKF